MKTLYGCDHCAFSDDLKGIVSFHEDHCIKNPEVKTCFTCEHHTTSDEFGIEIERSCNVSVSPHIRKDCEYGVVNCNEYKDKR